MTAHVRWTLGIVVFFLALGSLVAFDEPTSVVGGLAAVVGGLVVGFIVGALARDLINPVDARPRSWQGMAMLPALFVGLIVGRSLPGGLGSGAFMAALGGILASIAYFSPKLRGLIHDR